MNHEFDYDNADRKDLLERCKSFDVAVDAQHALCMTTFKERDTYRDLCAELIGAMRINREAMSLALTEQPLEWDIKDSLMSAHDIAAQVIIKAEKILGEKNAT